MANPIEITNIAPTRFVTASSRYAQSRVIQYSESKKLTFEIYKRGTYPPSRDDQFTVISKGMEYRPDLMSRRAYGTVDFWWRLLDANGMKDIMEFKAGTNIRIPQNIF